MNRPAARQYIHRLFGRAVRSPAPLPAPALTADPDIVISEARIAAAALARDPSSPFAYGRQADDSVLLTWMDSVRFRVSPDGTSVEFDVVHESCRALVFDYLLAQVLSVALLQQNVEALHATAVVLNGRAIAFLGDCGFGKSTLAAALLMRGARLLTDDLLVLERRGEDHFVMPGAKRIKLMTDAAAETIGLQRPATPLDELKSSYALLDCEFEPEPVPLSSIYVLRRDDTPINSPLKELLAATFNPLDERPERLKRQMHEFANIARLVHLVPLHLPWDLAALPAAAAQL